MDPRLRWQQLVAPDLSGASQALARANQSFNRGFETANGVLSQYDAGQKEQADQALLSDLAGLGDEAEFDAFIDGGGLEGRNISSTLRDHVLGARTGFVRDAGVRANTDGTRARTAIAQAAEGRAAGNYAYEDGRRRELAGLSGLVVGANQEGNQFGRGREGVQAQVYQGLLDRGMPEHVAQGFMMNFQDESGFDIDITEAEDNVHGTRGRGLYQLTGARRDAFEARYGNDYSVDNQLDWLMHELQGSESGARDAIFATQDAGSAGAAIVSNFLRPAEEHRLSRVAAYTGGNGFTPPNTALARPQFDRLQAALGGSQYLSPGDINGLLGSAYEAQGIGQGRLDAAEAARVQAASDAAVLGSFTDPTVNGQDPASILAAAQGAGLDDGATLDLLGRIQGAAQANPGIFNPQAPEDPLIAAAVEAEAAERARLAGNDPQQRVIGEAEGYNADPISSISSRFDREFSVEEREELNDAIDTLADGLRISRGEAAYALAESYQADPFGWNTVGNQFDSEAAVRFARDTFGPEARARAGDVAAIAARDGAQTEAATTRLQQLESQALRYSAAGRKVPPAIAREIAQTRDTLRAGSTPQAVQQQLSTYIARTGLGSRLEGLDPESPEFFRAMADLETSIQGDRSLSAEDKRLLISAIRG